MVVTEEGKSCFVHEVVLLRSKHPTLYTVSCSLTFFVRAAKHEE